MPYRTVSSKTVPLHSNRNITRHYIALHYCEAAARALWSRSLTCCLRVLDLCCLWCEVVIPPVSSLSLSLSLSLPPSLPPSLSLSYYLLSIHLSTRPSIHPSIHLSMCVVVLVLSLAESLKLAVMCCSFGSGIAHGMDWCHVVRMWQLRHGPKWNATQLNASQSPEIAGHSHALVCWLSRNILAQSYHGVLHAR